MLLFPEATEYDELAKRVLEAGGPLLLWAAGWGDEQMAFRRWMPTELTLPGLAQRICDAVAHLTDEGQGGAPVAGLVEVQTRPDPDMFDRIGLAGHLLRLTQRPTDLPGDRWGLCGIVLNLTGTQESSRRFAHAGAEWATQLRERHFARCEAAATLEGIARAEVPESVAAFCSLMKNGGLSDTIQAWLDVTAQLDATRRRELAAANVVFAELTDCHAQWREAVEGLSVGESPYLNSLRNDARQKGLKEGRQEGNTEARAEMLLRALRRSGEVPADLEAAIRACADPARLDAWFDLVLDRLTLDEFRRQAGI